MILCVDIPRIDSDWVTFSKSIALCTFNFFLKYTTLKLQHVPVVSTFNVVSTFKEGHSLHDQ